MEKNNKSKETVPAKVILPEELLKNSLLLFEEESPEENEEESLEPNREDSCPPAHDDENSDTKKDEPTTEESISLELMPIEKDIDLNYYQQVKKDIQVFMGKRQDLVEQSKKEYLQRKIRSTIINNPLKQKDNKTFANDLDNKLNIDSSKKQIKIKRPSSLEMNAPAKKTFPYSTSPSKEPLQQNNPAETANMSKDKLPSFNKDIKVFSSSAKKITINKRDDFVRNNQDELNRKNRETKYNSLPKTILHLKEKKPFNNIKRNDPSILNSFAYSLCKHEEFSNRLEDLKESASLQLENTSNNPMDFNKSVSNKKKSSLSYSTPQKNNSPHFKI